MKSKLLRILGIFGFCAGILVAQTDINERMSVLPEGEFPGAPGGQPRGWSVPHPNWLGERGMSIDLLAPEKDRPGNIVRFVNDSKPLQPVSMGTSIIIKPEWYGKTMIFEMDMRSARLVPGVEGWHNARLIVSYVKPDGKLDYSPGALFLDYDQLTFVRKSIKWKVPEGAKQVNLGLGLFHCAGVFDVRDLVVTIN